MPRSAAARSPLSAWAVFLVGLVALLWRLAYLQRLAQTPLAGTLRGDELSYWNWATFLVEHGLRGTNPFFQGPLYPYALALARALTRWDVPSVLVLQAVWGTAGACLVADAIRRLAGPPLALVFGALVAVNSGWVFFDGLILSESLLLFLEALLLWIWCRSDTRTSGPAFATAGALVIGLLAQGRATAALLLVPHAILIAARARSSRKAWLPRTALAAAVFLATALPSAMWNYSRTHGFMPFTYNSGLNLYVGNNPEADGTYRWIGGVRRLGSAAADAPDGGVEFDGREYLAATRGLSLTPLESSAYWTRQALSYIGTHPWLTLERSAYKLLLMLNHQEVSQIEHRGTFERLAGPVGLPFLGGFGLIAWLGLLGLLFAHRWGEMGRALLGYVACTLVAIVPFFVTDRYQVHLVPALAVLGALGAKAVVGAPLRPSAAVARRPVLGGVAAACLVWAPLGAVDRQYETWLEESDLGVRWLEAGDAPRAVATFERALGASGRLSAEMLDDPDARGDRAKLLFNYGVALRRVGREDEAIPRWREAAALDPTNARYVRTLSDALRLRGRTAEADSLLAQVKHLVGGGAESLVSEGFRSAREGRLDEARVLLERAVALDGRQYGAWGALIRVHVLQGNLDAGRATFDRARSAGLPSIATRLYEALLVAGAGDTTTAKRQLGSLEDVRLDPTLEYVREWTRELIRNGGARAPARN